MWKVISKYDDIWSSCLNDIQGAKASIKFEQYILTDFEPGSIGDRFMNLFVEKAKSGVKVRIIADMVGSYALYFSDKVKILEQAGVEVIFHTASTHKLRNVFKSFFRDHRKLLVVDDRIAHIGGFIVEEKARDWGELDVRFEGEGGVVTQLARSFDHAWHGLKEENAFKILKPDADSSEYIALGSSPRNHEHHILRHIIARVKSAESYIRIVSPYFVPTYKLFREILKARRRGVRVEIILPEKIDNIVAKYTSHVSYDTLLSRGVSINLYNEYNHAKLVIVDDSWCTFGSANLDRLSYLHNYELNVSSKNKEFVQDLNACFNAYLSKCRTLKLEEWRSRSWREKVLEKLSLVLMPIA